MLFSVTVKCSLIISVTVTVKCSVLLMFTHLEVFSVPYGHVHPALFIAPYGYCYCQVFSAPYGHCHSAPYRSSAVVMNVPGPRTASRQNDAAASHSYHFNTVLYPRSYSQCQPPLNRSCRYITGAAFSVKIFAVTALSSLHLCRPVNIYIMLYNVPL